MLAIALIFLFVLAGGGLRSVEAGCQNSLQASMKNPWLCGVTSYAVALAGFSIALTFASHAIWPTWEDVQAMPWWAPFGGLLGGAAVLGMITVAKDVGVATFSALVIVGEMLVALAMDHYGLMGFHERPATLPRFIGCALITAAIYLMARESKPTTERSPELAQVQS